MAKLKQHFPLRSKRRKHCQAENFEINSNFSPLTICSKCNREAITFIRYSGAHLCERHFDEFFVRRVRKEIRWQIDIGRVKHIAVAVSGGKDSAAALYSVKKILGPNPALRVSAVTVDEGIEGYRPPNIKAASEICKELDVVHEVISFKDIVGIELDEVAKLSTPLSPCSYCGVWRKKCLNVTANRIGANVLVTGHNLDDIAQSVAMNVFNGDVKRLVRMGPHRKIKEGLVPRSMPLRTIPEKETYLWAYINDIRFEDTVCPYSATAHRGLFRDVVNKIERNTPGTRHRLLASYDEMYDCLVDRYPEVKLNQCDICGEPTSGKICKACEMEIAVKGNWVQGDHLPSGPAR